MKEKRYYQLYANKKLKCIKVEPLKNLFAQHKELLQAVEIAESSWSGIYRYNDLYFFSTNKDLLLKKAAEIQDEWIAEAKQEYEEMRAVKIQTKYKIKK